MYHKTNGDNHLLKFTDMKNTNVQIAGNITKSTEKAILLETLVSFNGNTSTRSVWFPKSQIAETETRDGKDFITVPSWLIAAKERDNAFAGYAMRFEFVFNA